MKKTIMHAACLCGALLLFSSCELFENDNYAAPDATLRGEVVDVATGKPVLTDQGSEGIRVRITELSWGDNVQHNPDFYCRPDGTFQNTKVFSGEYNIRVDGPFIPLVRQDDRGVPLHDGSITTQVKGTTDVRFEVQPFLNVELVGTPTVSNGQISARVRVTRAVSKEDFRAAIEPMGGWEDSFTDITDIQLFVSYSSTVGYRARDERWSSELKYDGSSFDPLLGANVAIQSNGNIPSGRKVFIRAAARINYATENTKRWNYSEPMEVIIP